MPGSILILMPARLRNMTTGMPSGSRSKVAPEILISILKSSPRDGMLTKIEFIFPRARYKKINITQPKSPSLIRKISNTSNAPSSSTTIMTSNSAELSMLTMMLTLTIETILINFWTPEEEEETSLTVVKLLSTKDLMLAPILSLEQITLFLVSLLLIKLYPILSHEEINMLHQAKLYQLTIDLIKLLFQTLDLMQLSALTSMTTEEEIPIMIPSLEMMKLKE